MRELEGKVAVVTGGASGIGLALARRFQAAGMKVALADVEATALEEAASEHETHPAAELFRRLGEDAETVFTQILEQEKLDRAPTLPHSRESCGKHLGIVHDEQIARLENLGKLFEAAVSDRAARKKLQKSRGIPRLDGLARDELFGKLVVELFELQNRRF